MRASPPSGEVKISPRSREPHRAFDLRGFGYPCHEKGAENPLFPVPL